MLYFQLVIMAGTVLLAYYFECTDTFQVHIQGFFCQDGDLMKPYPGTEEESFISPLVLYCVLAATPTAIVSTEAVLCCQTPESISCLPFFLFPVLLGSHQQIVLLTVFCFS
jgi:hypothetical protein